MFLTFIEFTRLKEYYSFFGTKIEIHTTLTNTLYYEKAYILIYSITD